MVKIIVQNCGNTKMKLFPRFSLKLFKDSADTISEGRPFHSLIVLEK